MKTQKNTFENFPEWLIEKWQDIADILAESIGVPAALVMRTENEFREVFISNQSENNPYHVGEKEKWHGLYCETVIKSQNKLSITNALKDKNWDKNPDIELGMIAYLGYPINYPNNQPFGTLCILDNKENSFTSLDEKLLLQFKNVIELDLALIQTYDIETNELSKTIKDQQSQLSSKNIELQKAKAKAEESEKRYSLLIDSVMYPVIVASFEGNILYINQKTADFLDVKIDEYQELKSLGLWADKAKRNEYIVELQAKGFILNKEVQFRNKHDQIITVIMSSNIIDYNGQKAIFSIYNNISERKKAEEALRLSEEKFSKAFNISPDAITLTDIETSEIIDANAGFERVYGYAVKDVIGKTALELDIWADLSSRSELIKILNRDGIVLDFEARGRRKSGELSHGLVSGSIITVGERKMLLINARDITEHKKAEEVLRQSEARLNAILSSMNDIIFEIDLNNYFQGYFAPNNKSLYVQPDFFIGKKFDEILPEDVSVQLHQAIESIHSGNPYQQFEYHLTVDNIIEWEHAVITPRHSKSNELVGVTVVCRNITERKKAEESLEESQRKLATLMGNLPGLAFRCMNDSDWTMTFISDGCFELTGFYPQELEGNQINSYGNLIHRDDAEMVWQKVQDAINNHTFWKIEYRIRTKDGKEKWVWEQGCGVYSNTGELEVLEGFISDITVRKQAEKAIQESEEKHRYLVDKAPIGIFQRSIQGSFNFCNLTLAKQFECKSIDEFLLNYNDITTRWADPEQLIEFNKLLLKNGEVLGFENKVKLINGKTKWFSLYYKLDSTKSLLDGFSLDITERKKTEKLLQESENNFKLMIANSPDAIIIQDINGSAKFVSNHVREMFGYEPETFIGKPIPIEYIFPDDIETCLNAFKALQAGTEVVNVEYRFIKATGEIIWLNHTARPIIIENVISGIQNNVRDITERKKADANLIKLYTAINSSKASIVITDIDGNIEFANPYFTELTSFSEDEYLGKNPRVLKSGIHSDEYYKALWDTINSGKTWEGEFCNRKKTGELYWEKSIITPIKNEKEEIVNFVAVKSDISHEKKHEYLDDITLEIYEKSEYLSVEEVLKLSIELGIQLTDSEIGFFHFVNEDQETISLQAWSAKTMDICNVPTLDKHYPISKAGVWVDCFYQKKPVYHNDYSSLSHKKGLPEGHATLTRDLSVPVIVENKIVAIFGVGNKETNYTEIDAEFLSVFAENIWNVIRRKKSEIELIDSKEQIHKFASHLQDVREEEKIAIAREIHDDLGQILVALQIDTGLLKNKVIKTIPLADSPEILPKFDNIVDLIKRSIKTARSIMNGLRPELLELRGLVGAINEYLREFEERYHISCEFNDDIADIEMTPQQSLALFRILQEAMNNIVKHAKATLVQIQLQNSDNKVALIITDNGVGFDKKNSGRNDSYGMIGMKERVVLLKGELEITSEIGHGTKVKVEITY